MSLELIPPCTYIVRKPDQARDCKHPTVVRAEASRKARNDQFWEAYAEWREVKKACAADESRWRVEEWVDRISAAEVAMLTIGVTSASAVGVKLTVTDDPRSYLLPGSVGNLLQMITWDLERISMLELTGLAYSGEIA